MLQEGDWLSNLQQVSRTLARIIQNTTRLIHEGYYQPVRSFPDLPTIYDTIQDQGFVIMGEIKPGSPTTGIVYDSSELQTKIDQIGSQVDALSVLTEPDFFYGDLKNLQEVLQFDKPVLMKDFVIDARQIEACNGSTVLLIKRILTDHHMEFLLQTAEKLGREVLIEVDNEEDFIQLLDSDIELLAINNRNLGTMEVDTTKTTKLLAEYQPDKHVIGLSGYTEVEAVISVVESGASGVLIGTALSQSTNPGQFISEIRTYLEGRA